MKNKQYKKAAVLKRLQKMMESAFANVWDTAKEKKTDLKEASYLVALNRILKS